jgi:Tfp pilus assembly protein PilO
MQPKKQFTPAALRSILATLLVVVVASGGAVFYFGLEMVREFASEVNQSTADAEASGKQINQLQTLKNQLSQSNSLVDKANKLFATPTNYQSAQQDIESYAKAAGISIASITFPDAGQSNTRSMSVNLKNPVSYTGLIAFLNNIEGNLPKLQVSSITLSHSSKAGANFVEVGEIKIDISVR